MHSIPLFPSPSDLVLMVFGQSHPGNSGDTKETSGATRAAKFNPVNSNFYECADPLPDSSGGGGSFLTLLGHQYASVSNKPWGRLIIVPGIANGTSAAEWIGTTRLQDKVITPYEELVTKGWNPAQFAGVWVQGSSDVNSAVSPETYKANWCSILGAIREAEIDMPIFIGRSTHCRLGEGGELHLLSRTNRVTRLKSQTAIHDALANLPDEEDGTYPGPNYDFIGSGARHDSCHFSTWGMQVAAEVTLQHMLDHVGSVLPVTPAFAIILNSDYADNGAKTLRNVIPINAGCSQFRVGFEQNTGTGGRAIANASIMPRSSGASGSSSPIRITFNGGQNGATLSNSARLWSDVIESELSPGEYLVSFDQASGQNMRGRQRTTGGHGVYKASSQLAMQQSGSGFTQISAAATIGVAEVQRL